MKENFHCDATGCAGASSCVKHQKVADRLDARSTLTMPPADTISPMTLIIDALLILATIHAGFLCVRLEKSSKISQGL
jgi:hypothetical protein